MAPVKPMGVGRPRVDSNPKTRPGVTGFEQEYNQEPTPSQDLNPDAVDNPDVLPPAQTRATAARGKTKAARTPRR